MEELIKKMDELEELIKAMPGMALGAPPAPKPPSIKSPNAPGRPAGPGTTRSTLPSPKGTGIKPPSKKNPLAVAHHLEDPNLRDLKVQEAKEAIGFNARGQWRLK